MEKVFAWRPCRFVRSGQRLRNGAGFPNRANDFQSEHGLILQDLSQSYYRDDSRFSCYSAPKADQSNHRFVLSY